MAQLNTTAENLQWKSNMIIAGAADTDWASDSKYPSAKAVADKISTSASGKIEHPVGSIVITSTNTNPGSTLGGTWQLIDKEYKNDYRATYNFNGWTPATTNGATLELSSRGGFFWNGHSLFIQMVLVTPSTVELASGAVLGTISRPACGIKENGTFYQCPESGIALVKAGDSNYTISYEFYYDGTITFKSIVSSSGTARTTLPKGAKIYIDVPIQVLTNDMLDNFCDKFYWKRLATQSSTSEPIETPASEGLEYALNDDGVSYSVSGIGTCEDTDIVIPSSYNNLPVTSTVDAAFRDCTSLTSITIPDSVTSIGISAFSDCRSLTNVVFDENIQLTSIGGGAFHSCSSLTSITIPDGVTDINMDAFDGCSSLTSIDIPDSVTYIGPSVFSDCSSLTIYCEANSKPEGWAENWNEDNRPVVWGSAM